jgi:hypothetical protein
MSAVASDAVESLIAGFRSSSPVSKVAEAVVIGATVHPMLIASKNFVDAEAALNTAKDRIAQIEEDWNAAKVELTTRTQAFDEKKAALAELVK